MSAAPSGVGRYRALFANRAVALFVTALVFTRIGDQFVAFGLLWAALELTHSAVAAGLTLTVYSAALIAAGLFAASLLDRYPRKPLIVLDNAVRVVAIGAIAAAGWTHHLTLAALLTLAAAAAFASAITVVATRAYLPTLVPEELIITVFAVDSTLYNIASIAGPAMAGLVVSRYGASAALAAGAFCFAVFVAIAAFIPTGALDAGVAPETKPLSIAEELRGARYIVSNAVLRGVTLLTVGGNFFFTLCLVGLAFLSKDALGAGARGQGWMLTAIAIGALGASLALGTGRWRYSRGRAFIAVNFALGVLLAVLGFVPSLHVALVLLVIVGAVDAAFFILMSELRQRTPPPELLARVIAASMILNVLAMPLANAATGFAVTAFGVRPMFVAAGILLVLYTAVFFANGALRKAP